MARLWRTSSLRRLAIPVVILLVSVAISGCQGWFTQYSTSNGSNLTGISCPTTSVCYAVGATASNQTIIEKSSDGGATWAALSGAVAGQTLSSVSCADADHCVFVGGSTDNVSMTTDGGMTWSSGTIQTAGNALTSVSCITDIDCWATENGYDSTYSTQVFITTDGGTDWTNSNSITPAPTGAVGPGLTSITCPTASECLSVGDDILWINDLPIPVPELFGILASSTDGGMTWQTQTLPSSFLYGVSCLTDNSCVAVGAGGIVRLTSSDSGASWSANPVTVPGLNGYPEAVSCPDNQHCIAVGAAENGPLPTNETPILTTSDGGATWSVQTNSADPVDLYGVSCPTTSECWAAGSMIPSRGGSSTGSIILKTVTSGVSWPSVSSLSPSQGPASGGTQVTIMGAGFWWTPTVTFGSGPGATPATSVKVVSPDELLVTAPVCTCTPPPPGGFSVPVTVTIPGLGSATNLNYPFIYANS